LNASTSRTTDQINESRGLRASFPVVPSFVHIGKRPSHESRPPLTKVVNGPSPRSLAVVPSRRDDTVAWPSSAPRNLADHPEEATALGQLKGLGQPTTARTIGPASKDHWLAVTSTRHIDLSQLRGRHNDKDLAQQTTLAGSHRLCPARINQKNPRDCHIDKAVTTTRTRPSRRLQPPFIGPSSIGCALCPRPCH
jgi:hypothetical protein